MGNQSKLDTLVNHNFIEECGFIVVFYDTDGKIHHCSEELRQFVQQDTINQVDQLLNRAQQVQISEALKQDCPVKLTLKLERENEALWLSSQCKTVEHDGTVFTALLATNITSEMIEAHRNKNIMSVVQSASELLKIGYWQFKLNPEEIFWSDEVYNIYDESPEEYKPTIKSAMTYYHPEDGKKVYKLLDTAINHGEGWVTESLRLFTKSGEERYVVSCGNVRKDEHGQVIELFGTIQNVTKQETMQLERDYLALALKETSVGMVVADINKDIIWVNDAFEVITGYSLDDVRGSKLGPILQGANTSRKAIKNISMSLKNCVPVKERILNYRKNGEAYWNELLITPISSGRGSTYFFAIQNDVTQEVQAKLELDELNKTLQQQVEERTQELARKNQELSVQANYDSLTECLNRRKLKRIYDDLDEEIRNAQATMSLIMLDIDHFKSVNDQYGHHAGDETLKAIANQLKTLTRDSDVVFRMGGEEFLVLLPHIPQIEATSIAERIRKSIEGLVIAFEDIQDIRVSVSMGVLTHSGGLSLEESLKRIDAFLYQAKVNGRNQVVVR